MTQQADVWPREELTLAEGVSFLAWGHSFSSQKFDTAEAAEVYR